ncbi:substrate-binding domain-containing protein [Rhizobacter sp. J219]|uniref:LacI family DNA-binding transcriptional regulator n=1 Tax=Rhizobacter sp. J219 TaxID=2898430 RepID=UPI0021514C4D|nr:substrate-binding domain-containing protein [Rhizobacter sp. J219]MCR5881764.1 substrate-binding domain-containing protein [Rhizobacter sp. J219]
MATDETSSVQTGARSGRVRLTLADVAATLGISRTTVSNAFNRPEQLSKELRETILTTARELGYFGPDPKARALRRKELREVALVFHHDLPYAFNDPLTLDFMRGVARQLQQRGLTLQLIPMFSRQIEPTLDVAFKTTADALIFHAEVAPEFASMVRAAPLPLVVVDTMVPGAPSVCLDDRRGAELAMTHALKAKPDVVLVLCFFVDEEPMKRAQAARAPRSPFNTCERVAGYAQAARRAGFDASRIVWHIVDDGDPEAAALRAVEQERARLCKHQRIAVVAMSDRIALAAMGAMRSWPKVELVSVVGFDDIPAAAAAGLTTVRQDGVEKGESAVRVVLDDEPSVVLPLTLVPRDT